MIHKTLRVLAKLNLSRVKHGTGAVMTETKYAVLIKNLFQEYYQRHISIAEYRERRNKIIREMDRDFNGVVK